MSQGKLVNSLLVDTPSGPRCFDIVHGDVCDAEADLLAISVACDREPLWGQVINTLRARHGYVPQQMRPLLLTGGQAGTYEVVDGPPPGFKKMLVVRTPGAASVREQGGDTLGFYREAVWSLFGSISALELRGERYPRVVFPLIAGNRDYPQPEGMKILLDQALAWLTQSPCGRSATLYLYKDEHVALWSDAMNVAMRRSKVETARSQVRQVLRDDILGEVPQLTLTPGIERALGNLVPLLKQERLVLEQVAVFARAFAEAVAEELRDQLGQRKQPTLRETIQALESSGRIAPWICGYMHSLRLFGNESLHAPSAHGRVPPSLQDGDLLAILTSTFRVMEFWIEWSRGDSRPPS